MTNTTLPGSRRAGTPASPPPATVGPLGRLAGWAYRRRATMLVIWLVAVAAAVGISTGFAGEFSADYSTPGSDSRAARELLEQRFPALAGESIGVVVHADADVTSTAVRERVDTLLAQLATVPHVTGIDSPYADPGSVSADGRTAVAQVRLDVATPDAMPVEDTRRMLTLADDADGAGVEITLSGEAVRAAEAGEIGSEALGFAAAALILLVTFGSLVAAGLPLAIAATGLAVSSMLVPVAAAVLPVPDWSTALAAMLGIGIGIDYVLLMVTRFREWRAAGLDPEAATVATMDTAGRSILLAGSTVVVSMLGLFAMGLSFMRGAAVSAILAVLIAVAAGLTLLPALLGFVGTRIDSLRLPGIGRRRASATPDSHGQDVPSTGWLRWSRLVERRRIAAAAAGVAILLALAAPFLGVRFGFPDAGNDGAANSTRQAYDLQAAAFGPGSNGPLVLAADLPATGGGTALEALSAALRATDGVAAVAPPRPNEAGDTAILTVIPTTGPQDGATGDLVRTLRDTVIPAVTADTGMTVHVGGATATAIDSTANVIRRLPLLIGGVVGLSMLLLLASFRSVAVAVKAAAMNLLSVAAAYGVVAHVLEGGWAGRLIGIDNPTPMPAFVPVLMFAVLFGLSMDYEVFLVARMREVWVRTGDNARAIVGGLAGTARVITAAAAIMVAVFAAFVPSTDVVLKMIGVGMAAAILIDATVVRMLLVPAVMHLLGRRNWWLPAGLDRRLPHLYVEGRPDVHENLAMTRQS
jgi:putative drug exporter of the RND superfamily